MKKIIILISTLLIISCNKDDSSKVTPPENEVNISFETVAIGINGNFPPILKDTLPSKGIGFHFTNQSDWQDFKSKYLDLFLDRVVYQKNIDFNDQDILALIYNPSDGNPYIEIKRIINTDSTINIYYEYLAIGDSYSFDQPYHIVKTKKLNKKIIYIQQ
jgi:hypothetical protein